ncbi:Tetratricopeptide repeat protein 14 [Trichoplax sp. H2]|nr:Tetratricopeptide repeat protein 14 [Trichoplax sp. H2]|eukprot:RDD43224.1 Tetratricopeptide repeat protein 14 [Trichoplax sp. H2]
MADVFAEKLAHFTTSTSKYFTDFKKNRQVGSESTSSIELCRTEHNHYVQMPPLEQYMGSSVEQRRQLVYQTLKIGDIVDGIVTSKRPFGLSVLLLSLYNHRQLHMSNLEIYASCHASEFEIYPDKPVHSRLKQIEDYAVDDFVRGVIYKIDISSDEIMISLQQEKLLKLFKNVTLGMIEKADIPYFCTEKIMKSRDTNWEDYNQYLKKQPAFYNTKSINTLSNLLGIDKKAKIAFLNEQQSLAIAIEYFKQGNNSEAMIQIQQSLKIDKSNYEAIVAKGAIMANEGHFEAAIDSFEEALQLNPKHRNGLKYLCETLQTMAERSINDLDYRTASKFYEKLLKYNPAKEAEIGNKLALCREAIHKRAASKMNSSKDKAASRIRQESSTNTSNLHNIKKILAAENLSPKSHNSSKKKKKKKKSKKKIKRKKSGINSSCEDFDNDYDYNDRKHSKHHKHKSQKRKRQQDNSSNSDSTTDYASNSSSSAEKKKKRK